MVMNSSVQLAILDAQKSIEQLFVQVRVVQAIHHAAWNADQGSYKIHPQTRLSADLNIDSLTIVHLIFSLEKKFDCHIDFSSLLIQDGNGVEDISIAQLVTYISDRLTNIPLACN